MVLLHLGTDGPIAFVHTNSYWIRAQTVPSVIRHVQMALVQQITPGLGKTKRHVSEI